MLRTLSVILSLGLFACGGGGKPADRAPGDPDPDPDTVDPKPSGASCCCETYDLETPDIVYSTMSTSECTSASGHCEDTDEYCQAE